MTTTDLCFPLEADDRTKIETLATILELTGSRDEMRLVQFNTGITNSTFKFVTPERNYTVRVYGNNTDKLINRNKEIENIRLLKYMEIFAIFGNGMIVEFQPGRTITCDLVAEPEMNDRIAREVAKLHRKTMHDGQHKDEMIPTMYEWAEALPQTPDVADAIKTMEDFMHDVWPAIEEDLGDSPIFLCHNDVQCHNICWDSEKIKLIDFEYAAWTWPQFEIANHFGEWCGFQFECNLFPSIERQKRFIRVYLTELYGKEPAEETVDKWRRQVCEVLKLVHIFYSLWGYFQEEYSTGEFPFIEYGKVRQRLSKLTFPLEAGNPLLTAGPLLKLD